MTSKSSVKIINAYIMALFIVSSFFLRCQWFIDNCHTVISVVSLILLVYHIRMLKRVYGIGIVSVISIFIILCNVFNFGNFYLKMFGKEEYYIFTTDWFSSDVEVKARVGFYSLWIIQSLFTGICLFLSNDNNVQKRDYKRFISITNEQKKEAICFAGKILLIISFPCRIYWDIKQIQLTQNEGSYIGGYSAIGLIDDISALFVPALICFMYSRKENKKMCRVILLLYLLYSGIIIILSGSRRTYVTAFLGLFVFYSDIVGKKKKKEHSIIYILLLMIGLIVLLNFLTIIREQRHSLDQLSGAFDTSLFSLDFVWNTLGECGITGMSIYYAFKFFPFQLPFYCGMNFVMSIVFVLPIGWLFHYSFATTLLNTHLQKEGILTKAGIGSSIICELYSDFGWISIVIGIIVGYYIGKLGLTKLIEKKYYSVQTVIRYCLGIVIIGSSRGSTSEIIRSGVYTVVSIYFLSCLYLRNTKQYNMNLQ